jgi:type VI secretion system secreted protein VgrG
MFSIHKTCKPLRIGSIAFSAFVAFVLQTGASAQLLGTAEFFAVLGGSTVTNTGPTQLFGNLGVWPGTSITGFPPGIVTDGTIHAGDGVAETAQADLTVAYNVILGEAFDSNLSGQDLGNRTLTPGVYHFDASAPLNGDLILDAQGDPNARFDFQIGSTFLVAIGATVTMINAGDACNVYWQVGSSATLGTDSAVVGHVMALTSITMDTRATILEGNALARNGAVTMDTNTIAICEPVPEPATWIALGVGIAVLAARKVKH